MVQRGQRFGFALESSDPLGIGVEQLGQDLERDIAIQFPVASPIHLAHTASPERTDDFVRAEPGAGCEHHKVRGASGADCSWS